MAQRADQVDLKRLEQDMDRAMARDAAVLLYFDKTFLASTVMLLYFCFSHNKKKEAGSASFIIRSQGLKFYSFTLFSECFFTVAALIPLLSPNVSIFIYICRCKNRADRKTSEMGE